MAQAKQCRSLIMAAWSGFIMSLSCQHVADPANTSLESIPQNYSNITEPRARWQAYGLKNYIIEQERLCFCGFPHGFVKLVVQNNKIVAGTDLANGQPVLADLLQYYQTIDELFDWIEQAKAENPARLEIEYEARFGYPKRVEYDYSTGVADDELWIGMQSLHKLSE